MGKYNNKEWLNKKYNSLTVKDFIHKDNSQQKFFNFKIRLNRRYIYKCC